MKKPAFSKVKEVVFPSCNEKERKEIDMLNVVVLRRIAFLCAIIELAAFITAVTGISKVSNKAVSLFSTAFAVVLCVTMNVVLRIIDKRNYYNHMVVVTICNSFSMLFILWAMAVSGYKYMMGYQIITFYVVVVALICFTVMIPKISLSIIAASFIGFYIFMYQTDKAASVQTFNYFAFMMICCGASIEKYSVIIAKVRGKIQAEELNDSFHRIMRHDTLSKVKNRSALVEDLPQYLNKKIIVIIFDLDKFKTLNDKYGHISGDKVIASYARAFSDVFNEEAVYRYGGDEFLVVLEATTQEKFEGEMKRLREIADNMEIEGIEDKTDYSFGYSFGIVENGNEFEALVIKADEMLYEQKRKKHSENN